MEAAKEDKDIVALCSDSREVDLYTICRYVSGTIRETGIAEQNLVSIAAGLAKCGKKSYGFTGMLLSTRSYEQ